MLRREFAARILAPGIEREFLIGRDGLGGRAYGTGRARGCAAEFFIEPGDQLCSVTKSPLDPGVRVARLRV